MTQPEDPTAAIIPTPDKATLQPYKFTSPCVKCGHASGNWARHMRSHDLMERRCQVCNYIWYELPKDYVPPPDPDQEAKERFIGK